MIMRQALKSLTLASCLAASLAASTGAAADPVKIKFTLDSKAQGPHAWFYWARARGYFSADAAIDLLAAEEPLIEKDIEKRRLLYVYKALIDTPESRDLGIGDVNDIRLKAAISTVVTAFELSRAPPPGEIFDASFLPAKADRIPPTITP
jgi:hypothetical protein